MLIADNNQSQLMEKEHQTAYPISFYDNYFSVICLDAPSPPDVEDDDNLC